MKAKCNEEFMDRIINMLATAPKDEISPRVRKMIKKFRGPWWRRAKHTATEKYDFINQFRRLGQLCFNGEVTTFVGELCDLEQYYDRP